MKEMTFNIKLDEGAKMPVYAHEEDACMDIFSIQDKVLKPGERGLIKSGVHMDIPCGYELQVRSRSGLALKHGVCVLNAPGIVDAGYTGDIGIILINLGNEDFIISKGDKIAQIAFQEVIKTKFNIVDEITETSRSSNGFGSTGR